MRVCVCAHEGVCVSEHVSVFGEKTDGLNNSDGLGSIFNKIGTVC